MRVAIGAPENASGSPEVFTSMPKSDQVKVSLSVRKIGIKEQRGLVTKPPFIGRRVDGLGISSSSAYSLSEGWRHLVSGAPFCPLVRRLIFLSNHRSMLTPCCVKGGIEGTWTTRMMASQWEEARQRPLAPITSFVRFVHRAKWGSLRTFTFGRKI